MNSIHDAPSRRYQGWEITEDPKASPRMRMKATRIDRLGTHTLHASNDSGLRIKIEADNETRREGSLA